MKKLFTTLLLVVTFIASFAANPNVTDDHKLLFKGAEYNAGKVVIRVKNNYRAFCSANDIAVPRFKDALNKISASVIYKKLPNFKMPAKSEMKSNYQPVDMSLVYQIEFSPVIKIETVMNALMSTGILVYADPLYIHKLDFTPNDAQIGSQYHIGRINCYTAWDVWQGDTNTVIGIVDSGTDWSHPDLQANIKYNYADQIDGLDNDSDGFIDNFRGWDVSDNDNDPQVGNQSHGSHVSGCANAVTNNGTGVAGPAFNCKFLPVKSALNTSTSSIDNGYDGILYAVDHGANVINCSWGRVGIQSQFERDAVDYAVINKNSTLVAAAGNDNLDETHYPSSYDNVVSVAATTAQDKKAGFSSYNATVDVSAPGAQILSTIWNASANPPHSYAFEDGTSMASPIAAGCAAMIKSRWPSFTALQVGEQLRTTCTNINAVSGNATFIGKMGKGRVNLFAAVTDSVSPGVRVRSSKSTDNDDDVFMPGDTISLTCLFENLLRPTTNLVCSLTTNNSNVSILQPNFAPGAMQSNDTISNYVTPYSIFVKPTALLNTVVDLRVNLTDGAWTDIFTISLTVNVDYVNIQVNNVASSMTSRSLLGFNDEFHQQGLGFTYLQSPTILYDLGLMVGAQGTQVSDNVRNGSAGNDADFLSLTNVVASEPGPISDFDVYGVFRDSGTTPTALKIEVAQHAYAWVNAPDDNYIMVQYYIKNKSSVTLTNLYAGLFADWDVPAYANNKCSSDIPKRMGYIWSTDVGGLYGGIKLLSHTGGFNHYALDNIAVAGSIDMTNGFTDAEKYTAMSTSRTDAGTTSTPGNDVLSVVSSGNFNLAPGDSVEVAFALIAGPSLTALETGADAAQLKYDQTFVGIESPTSASSNELFQSYPNPADKSTRIVFYLKEMSSGELGVYNVLGEKILTPVSGKIEPGMHSVNIDLSQLPAGNYYYKLVTKDYTSTKSMTISH